MIDEYFKGDNEVVSKSSVVPDQTNTTLSTTTSVAVDSPPLNISNIADDVVFDAYEFINPFATWVTEVGELSSRRIDPSNMQQFYQIHPSEYHWTKDHPLEQIRKNPSKPVQTRRQLGTDQKMYMFALTISKTKPKNIKEAMADVRNKKSVGYTVVVYI
ncbi:hypothetical protein Tco_0959330 [Tanacetum coccineum]